MNLILMHCHDHDHHPRCLFCCRQPPTQLALHYSWQSFSARCLSYVNIQNEVVIRFEISILCQSYVEIHKEVARSVSKWIPQSGVFSNVIQNTPNQDAGYFDSHSFCITYFICLLSLLQTWAFFFTFSAKPILILAVTLIFVGMTALEIWCLSNIIFVFQV